MAKYRNRHPVEAEQWFPTKPVSGVMIPRDGQTPPCLLTPQGWRTVRPGSWIVTDNTGKQYVFEPDIFEATYEPVADSAKET